jgi:hypothetical protein
MKALTRNPLYSICACTCSVSELPSAVVYFALVLDVFNLACAHSSHYNFKDPKMRIWHPLPPSSGKKHCTHVRTICEFHTIFLHGLNSDSWLFINPNPKLKPFLECEIETTSTWYYLFIDRRTRRGISISVFLIFSRSLPLDSSEMTYETLRLVATAWSQASSPNLCINIETSGSHSL